MSGGCEGCFQSAKGMQEEYLRVKAEAVKFMTENNISITGIYKEGFQFFYIEQSKITTEPIIEYLSNSV